jgi:hypothetical protein
VEHVRNLPTTTFRWIQDRSATVTGALVDPRDRPTSREGETVDASGADPATAAPPAVARWRK